MFTDSINYPIAYRLFCLHKKDTDNAYASSVFFICSGLQTILCNMDSSREIPKISNSCMNEYQENFTKKYMEKHQITNKIYGNEILPLDGKYDNKLLLQYTEENPNSYLALWWLISKLYSYDSIYDSIYNKFSENVKTTTTGLTLARNLYKARTVAIGHEFPRISVLDSNYAQIIIPSHIGNNKYTLIDFWYTHCNPCMVQIPKFKKLYDQYKQKGFEIIGVSIDQEKYLNSWKNIINTRDWNWPQYWDRDAKNATEVLSIEGYPYNFLLDQNGMIIKRNIKPEELGKILASMQK